MHTATSWLVVRQPSILAMITITSTLGYSLAYTGMECMVEMSEADRTVQKAKQPTVPEQEP